MGSFTLVVCFGLFTLALATNSTGFNGYITKVKGITKGQVEIRREEISDQMIREYQFIMLDNITEDGVTVLYKDSLIVHGRTYNFDVTELGGKCEYGPIIDHHKVVYYHVRDLSPEENSAHLKFREENPETNTSNIGLPDDMVIPTFQLDEGSGEKITSTNKFSLVRPIKNVKFDCEEGAFCCGNRCCPFALQDFLEKVQRGSKQYEMTVPIDNETITLYVPPRELNSTSKRNCGYVIESDDYFEIDDADVDAVRYKCPKTYHCCADTLCCKNHEPHVKETFGTFIAGIKHVLIAIFVICGLLFVAGLWYWCHYRRHNRARPHTYIAPEPVRRQSSRMSGRYSESSP